MFLPVEKQCLRLLQTRQSIDFKQKEGLDALSVDTKNHITDLLNSLNNTEKKYESWRQKFYSLKSFSSRFIFDKIDTYGKNYLSGFDVKIELFLD